MVICHPEQGFNPYELKAVLRNEKVAVAIPQYCNNAELDDSGTSYVIEYYDMNGMDCTVYLIAANVYALTVIRRP